MVKNKKRLYFFFGALFSLFMIILFSPQVKSLTINSFNNSLMSENLTFTGDENITRYLDINRYANVTSGLLNLSGFVVSEGTYTGDNFDTDSGNSDPYGITQNGTYFWTVDSSHNIVYKYWMNGTYTGDSFDFHNQTEVILGITQNGTYFWITGALFDIVYKYWMNGTYTGDSFVSLGDGGITQNGTYFWITRVTGSRVYKYWMNGTYTGDSFDTGGSGNTRPSGITQNGIYFWVVDDTGFIVYKYWMNGTYTGDNFYISENTQPYGIINNGTYFWITDDGFFPVPSRVYKYWMSEPLLTNPYLEIGTSDENYEWNFIGEFNTTEQTDDFSAKLNEILGGGDCTEGILMGDNCSIAFLFHSDTTGILQYSDLNINYTSTNQPPTTPTSLLCDGALCTNNGTFIGNMEINCSGSTDEENNSITYSIDAFYNGTELVAIDHFNNSLTTENLSFTGNENMTRYLELPKSVNVTSALLNLTGLNTGGLGNSSLESQLNAYYDLEQSSGDATDIALGTHNATVSGGITREVPGRIDNGFEFDGVDGLLNISSATDLNFNDTGMSISFWINLTHSINTVVVVGKTGAGGERSWFLTLNDTTDGNDTTNNGFSWLVHQSDSSSVIAAGGSLVGDEWQFVVVTANTSDIVIYIDGAETGKHGYDGTIDVSDQTDILIGGTTFNSRINGTIDEIGFWSRALNVTEISELYNSGLGNNPFNNAVFPTDPYLEIGTPDGTHEWNFTGEFSSTEQTDDFSSAINSALNNSACDCAGCNLDGDSCNIPFLFHSDTAGILEYSGMNINYQATGLVWSNIGEHNESSVLSWDITDITPQSEVDLRCKAIDLNGSNTYSDYYDPAINITISGPALDIISLSIVYQNNTERVFRFVVNNTADFNLTNISWSLDTGENNESSQYNVTLQGGEDYFVYAYHNYTASGNYTVIARAENEIYSATKSIQIEV